MATTRGHESYKGQPLESAWLPILDRGIFLRATIVAVIIGSVLTLVNQSGWVAGREPLQFLQLILVFLLHLLSLRLLRSPEFAKPGLTTRMDRPRVGKAL